MSYAHNNLSVLAYANGFTLWHYTTDDTSIVTAGYFNDAAEMLRTGDVIVANVDMDGSPDAELVVVQSATSGAVQVAALP